MKAYQNLQQTGSIGITGSLTVQGDSIISGSLFVSYATASQTTGSNIFGTASWAMNAVGGGGGAATIVSASTPPTTSISGTLWYNTTTGNLLVQTTSPTGSTWVPTVLTMVTGSVTASVHHTNGFTVNSIASGSTFSGSLQVISGSIFMRNSGSGANMFGTASNAISASFLIGGAVPTIISASAPPSTSAQGTLWFNSSNGDLYIQTTSPTGSAWTPVVLDMVTGSVTASVHHRDGFTVNSSVSGSTFSGSIQVISGSIRMRDSSSAVNIFGTASNATSASYSEFTSQAPVIVSASSPVIRSSGSLWYNTDDGNTYVQLTTPSGSTWVPATTTVGQGAYGATFTFTQAAASTTWTIDHNFNTSTPIVQVYTGSQMMVPATITATTANRVTITFATAAAGTAIVSTGVGSATTSSFATTASFAITSTTSSFAQPSDAVFTDGGTITIGATTTAPTKGSMAFDRVYYRQKGPKVWEVVYNWYNNSGGGAGSGDYLLTLPNSLQFNSSALGQAFNTTSSPTGLQLNLGLGNAPAMMNTTLPIVFAIPYDATRFRIFIHNPSVGQFLWGSGYSPLTQLSIFKLRFEFVAV